MSSATSIENVLPPKGGRGLPPNDERGLPPKGGSYKRSAGQKGRIPTKGSDGSRLRADDQADAGFRPWHFFLLASLVAATVAVIMARQSTPEHLILLSVIIACAGFAAAAFYRMLAPLAADDAAVFAEPLSARNRAALEREKTLVLRSIKELEFDRAMGKVAPRDFQEMAGRLRARAIALMKQLDAGAGAAYRELIERELHARLTKGSKGSRGSAGSIGSTGSIGSGSSGSATAVDSLPVGACANCGTVNDVDAAFCKRCGGKLQQTAGAR